MNSLFWGLITVSIVATVIVLIYVMVELRAAIRSLEGFLKTCDTCLKPALDELQLTLRSVRGVTDNVSGVTEDLRVLSASVRNVGENVKHVSDLVEGVTSSTTIKVSGLRAGLNAALDVLLKKLFSRSSSR